MVLVDTSVWIDHLHSEELQLVKLLESGLVCIHPMIIGELACGNLQNRLQLLSLWGNLPHVVEASHAEVIHCIEQNRLMGRGVGFIDVHLLASALLSAHTFVWTGDVRLQRIAHELAVGWQALH